MSTTAVTFTIVIAIIAAALAALLFSRIQIELAASRARNNDRVTVNMIALYGLIRYRVHIPMINFRNWSDGISLKKKSDSNALPAQPETKEVHLTRERIVDIFERTRLIIKNIFNLLDWTKETIARIECTSFVWQTRVGVGDAPETAVITGIIWGVKSSLLGMVFRRICLKTQPNVQVSPQYNQKLFASELACKLQIRVSHVVMAGIRLIPHIGKAKVDWRTWRRILFHPRMKSIG